MKNPNTNEAVFKLKKTLERHHVELNSIPVLRHKLNNVMEGLYYDRFLLKDLEEIIEIVATINYSKGGK